MVNKKEFPNRKVLFFSPDLDVLRSIRNFMEGKNIEATCSNDIQVGEDLVFQEKFDCILIDFKIIKDDCVKWIEQFKGKAFDGSCPKIIVFLGEKNRERTEKLSGMGVGLCVANSFGKKLFLKDIYKCIMDLEPEVLEKELLANTDLEGEISGAYEIHQELLDEIARMSSKLEEALISETKLRKKLEEANKKKDELLSFAAHDLRSPLSTILSTVEFILNPEVNLGPLNADQINFLTSSREQTRQLIDMVDELLDLSKIQRGFIELSYSSFDFKSLVEKKCAYYSIGAKKKSISLKYEIERDFPPVMADKNKISSVLDNLIGNAIKYSSPGDGVIVRGRFKGNEIFVEVEDTGQGLREEELDKAFGAFQKLSARPTAGEKSTGLGLAIVKKIVEAHGGTVGVNSEHGKGSIFYFVLKAGS